MEAEINRILHLAKKNKNILTLLQESEYFTRYKNCKINNYDFEIITMLEISHDHHYSAVFQIISFIESPHIMNDTIVASHYVYNTINDVIVSIYDGSFIKELDKIFEKSIKKATKLSIELANKSTRSL